MIPDGQNVLVLAGAHSGKRGTLCGYEIDEAFEGCYGVDLWSGGRPTFVDRRSLLPRYVVTITGLVSRADLNGKSATVERWDEQRQRYEVELVHDQSRIALAPANMQLPLNARIRIHGLVAASQHNGKLAKVVAHWEARYDVEFHNDAGVVTRVRLKRENMRL